MPKQLKKRFATQRSVDKIIWDASDILRRGNCASALQYVPELTWILFLRILDEKEEQDAQDAEDSDARYVPSLRSPYRWRDWAAPPPPDAPKDWTNHRAKLLAIGSKKLLDFVNTDLLPHLKGLRAQPQATAAQKVLSEILSGVDRVRIDTERNLLEVLDRVDQISAANIDDTHVFPLSQIYEGLLLKMGDKGSDAGQFFTPREVIRAMVRVVDPRPGETVYDPCCGTGGFLAQAYEHMRRALGTKYTSSAIDALKQRTFFGREKENLIYPIGLANLVLHGIEVPHIWHGNALSGEELYGGLFNEVVPSTFDVVLTNPPFGGKESESIGSGFDYQTSATQMLFLQKVMAALGPKGRCGIVLDEGVLFRTGEDAYVQIKSKLLSEFNLYCIVSLPAGVFAAAGASVKTSLLFFDRGGPTSSIWYYDLSDLKVGKRSPMQLKQFDDLFARLPGREQSERSWTIDFRAVQGQAQKEAQPHLQRAKKLKGDADKLKDRLSALKKAAARDDEEIDRLIEEQKALLREVREAEAKAKAIKDAIYDLKARNPNRKREVDERTPDELLDFIEAKGQEVTQALTALRALRASSEKE